MKRFLPLLTSQNGFRHGTRSRKTCEFRCANQCDHAVPNTSGNAYFGEIAEKALSRRALLGGAAGAFALVPIGQAGQTGIPGLAAGRAEAAVTPDPAPAGSRGGVDRLDWKPVAPNTEDAVIVPEGFEQGIVVSWGDPVAPGAPAFDFENQTSEAQAQQYGYNCDYLSFIPLSGSRALLVSNHEYTDESLMFRGWTDFPDATPEQTKIAMAAHGLSVVELERVGRTGQWQLVREGRRRFNRRITVQTEMKVTGPAAGSPLLKTSQDPAGTTVHGTINNCAGGLTPWGTTLHGEENWHGYFDATAAVDPALQPAYKRYGLPVAPVTARNWSAVEPRFDVAKEPNEPNRFGWIVELDPFDPKAPPRKRTMLGRCKHEGANIKILRDGRVAAYTGDDERFEYVYKFVSRDRYRADDRRHNLTLLDHGTLYAAKFTGDGTGDGLYDGTGEWIPLCSDTESFVPDMSVDEVLVHVRLAADTVDATKMDRPEDIECNPVTGSVYVALTNNSKRTADQIDEPNPRAENKHGQVLELDENPRDVTKCTWRLILVCGDPDDPQTYYGGFDKSKVSAISCPDNVAFDRRGNLWVATDGNALESNDGLFALPVRGEERGYAKQFLTVPIGAETCGPLVLPDQKTVFAAVQHPGELDGASPEDPASHWPDGGESQPRPSVVCVWRP